MSVAYEGVVEVFEGFADFFGFDAYDDAVWFVEVDNGIAFFEELWVVCDMEGEIADDGADSVAYAEGGAYGDG